MPWRPLLLIDIPTVFENLRPRGAARIARLVALMVMRSSRRAPVALIFVCYLALELLFSVGTVNWGTAARHHVPSIGLLVVCGFARRPRRLGERAEAAAARRRNGSCRRGRPHDEFQPQHRRGDGRGLRRGMASLRSVGHAGSRAAPDLSRAISRFFRGTPWPIARKALTWVAAAVDGRSWLRRVSAGCTASIRARPSRSPDETWRTVRIARSIAPASMPSRLPMAAWISPTPSGCCTICPTPKQGCGRVSPS